MPNKTRPKAPFEARNILMGASVSNGLGVFGAGALGTKENAGPVALRRQLAHAPGGFFRGHDRLQLVARSRCLGPEIPR